jgi:hypothetical protein
MGWYCYLEEKLNVPFLARCVEERTVSPLEVGDEVKVVGMAPERECEREIFVTTPWNKRTLAVPLAQLEVIEADDQTREAVEDWHYWVGMGYEF